MKPSKTMFEKIKMLFSWQTINY